MKVLRSAKSMLRTLTYPSYKIHSWLKSQPPCTTDVKEMGEKTAGELAKLIKFSKSTPLDDETQKELAKILIAFQSARNLSLKKDIKSWKQDQLISLFSQTDIVIEALNLKNLVFAKRMRRRAEFSVRRLENPVKAFFVNTSKDCLYLSSTTIKVIFGFALTIPIHVIAPIIFMEIININYTHLNCNILPGLVKSSKQSEDTVNSCRSTNNPSQNVGSLKDENNQPPSKKKPEAANKVELNQALSLFLSTAEKIAKSDNTQKELKKALSLLTSTAKTISDREEVLSLESKASRVRDDKLKDDLSLLLLCAIVGSIGSIISIFLRLNEYDNEKYTDDLLPVLIGAFKPMIGAVFGMFVFALTSSSFLPGTININKNDENTTRWFSILSIAFVVGFSERFAKDIVSQTEKIFLTPENVKDVKDVVNKVLESRDISSSVVVRIAAQAKIDADAELAQAKAGEEAAVQAKKDADAELAIEPANSDKAKAAAKANEDWELATKAVQEKADKVVKANEDWDNAKASLKG
jgi:hypothetical protein